MFGEDGGCTSGDGDLFEVVWGRPWMWYKQVFFVFLRCDCLGIHFYLLGTCIKQQFNICSHSAHQSDFRTSLIWTGITIATLPISTFISVS